MVKTSRSSALSATFRSSPISPKTNITSAGREPTRWPLRHRGKAPWPTRLLALVMRPFPSLGWRASSRMPSLAVYVGACEPGVPERAGGGLGVQLRERFVVGLARGMLKDASDVGLALDRQVRGSRPWLLGALRDLSIRGTIGWP